MLFSNRPIQKNKLSALVYSIQVRAARILTSLLFAIIAALGTNLVVRAIGSALPLLAPSITVTKTDTLINDGVGGVIPDDDGDGNADPGETIQYTTTITNSGSDATGVTLNDVIDANTTFVGGSVNVSPLAINDSYDTIGNTLLEVGVTAGANPAINLTESLFDNDVEFFSEALNIFSHTNPANGTLVSFDNNTGKFSYLPNANFTGADTFTYTLKDAGGLTDTATVTINVTSRVWYVKNNTIAGGLGRSTDPFDTLAEAQTASSANDTIYIYQGDGTTAGQNAGITLKGGQRLIGEGVALTVPVAVNGGANPTTLRIAGSQPLIDNTGGFGVSVPDVSGVQIFGLNIAGNTNAVNITTTAANSGGFELANNTIRSAGTNGVDVNGGGSGTLTINMHDNTVTATGNGIDIARTAGSVTITTFDDNVISGNTGGTGINIVGTGATVLFDSNPGTASFETVLGGTTTIGQSGNAVGAAGLVLSNIRGDLSFTDLDIYATGNALFTLGTTPNYTGSTGTRVTASTNTPILSASAGVAADVTDANINFVLNTLSSSSSPTSGVSLTRVSGTFTAPSGSTITNATGVDFSINGGSNANANVAVTYNGTITDDVGTLVQIQNVTATSAHTFSGAITDGNDGDGSGIALTGNSGATINFSGGLLLSTGTNAAFTATGGGTVSATQNNTSIVNTLTTTTGTALNVANTTIGGSGLTFRSITSNGSGSARGIVLDSAGTGGLTVTGNGGSCTSAATCTGGTISNKTGADGTGNGIGIYVNNTSNVSITRMQLNDFSNYAIRGTTVTGFTLNNSNINGTNGDNAGADEGSIIFDDLFGTSSFSTDSIAGSIEDNFRVRNSSGTANDIVITGSTFLNAPNDNVIIEPSGTAVVTAHVTNNTFTGAGGDHLQTSTTNSATLNIIFTGNSYSNGFAGSLLGGITISGGNAGSTETVNFNISNNGTVGSPLVGNVQGGAININQGNGAGTWQGQVSNNFIGNAGVASSGSAQSSGIRVENHSPSGTLTAIIDSNVIRQWTNGPAINSQVGDAGNATNAAVINLTVTNNTAANPVVASAQHGFIANIGASAVVGDVSVACVDVRSNTLDGNAGTGGSSVRYRHRGSSTIKIPGYTNTQYNTAAVITFETTQNPGSSPAPTAVTSSAGPGYGNTPGGAPCQQPVIVSMLPNSGHILAQAQPETSPLVLAEASNTLSNSENTSNTVFASAVLNVFSKSTSASDITKLSKQASWVGQPVTTSSNADGGKPLFLPAQPAPMQSGETVNVIIGALPAGKSVSVQFRVTVDNPVPASRLLNQGNVTYTGGPGGGVNTTDPSPNADAACASTSPKTCTPVDRPDTTILSINRNASSPTNAASVSWTVTFADAISGLTSSNFTLTSSGVSGESITSVTPTGSAPATVWVVTANTGTGSGTLRLDLANDTSLSHDVTTAKPFIGQLYTIDKTPPTVTNVTSSTTNGSYKASDSISIQVVFSEAVTVTGTPQLTLETGTTDRIVDYVSGSGSDTLTFTYTVQAGDTSSDLDYTGASALTFNSGTIKDAATNNATLTLASPGAATSLGNNKALVIDTTAPTTTSFIRQTPSTSPTSADSLIFRATFSEAVTGVDTTDFAVDGTTTATVTNVTPFSSSVYDVTVSGGDLAGFNGTVGLNFGGALNITDVALNALASTEPTTDELYTMDNAAPAVTNVTSTSTNGTYIAAAVIPVTITFNEAVTVSGTPQLTLETGTTDQIVNYTSGSGTATLTFNYTVQAGDTTSDLDTTGTSALVLNSGTITDAAATNADLTLPTPGAAGSLGANKSIVIDAVAPTVTNVTSTKANGSYGTGVLIPVTITFSEVVTVSGTPQLTLETGATDRTVDYSSGSGTNTLTFNYTTQSGDISADLDYVATTSLALNSGTIADAAANNATLTLASPGAAGSLGANKNIVLDATEPTVTNVTSSTSNGSYTTSAAVSVQVTFSEAVTVTGTPQLTLETGTTDRTVDYTSGSGTATLTFSYTVQAGDTSADLDYVNTSSLALNSGSIQDVSTNNAILTLPTPGAAGSLGNNKAIVIDTTAPTVTNVTSSTSNGTYTTGAIIPVTVTFNEAVTVTGTPQLTLETGTTDRTVDYTSGSGTATLSFSYTVQAGDTSADLDYVAAISLALNSGTIKDTATNNATLTLAAPAAAGSLGANKAIVIDTTDPTVTGVSSSASNGSYTTGQVIAVQVTFSKAITVTGTPQLTLETGTTDRTVNYTSGSGTSTLTFNYTVQAGDTSADLDYVATTSLALNSGTIKDAATNNAVLTLPTPGTVGSLAANKAIVIDTTAPTITDVTSSKANGTYGVGTVINIQVTFSETINVDTSGGTPTLTLETGATDRAVNYTSGSGTALLTFAYTVQAGDISADLDAISASALALNSGTIKDTATNTAALTLPTPGAAGSLGANKAIVIDATPPTVTNVTSSKTDGSYGATTVIAVTVTFDETVTVTGTPQLTLETGATDEIVNYSSGSGTTTLTFNYTVQAGNASSDLDYVGVNSLALNSGTIKDATGNNATLTLVSPGVAGSLGANKALVIDASAPDTTINTNPSNPTNNTSASFTFSGDDGTGVGGLTFECKLDAGAYAVCTSPNNYAGPLANGNHTFLVRAKDSLGNTDTSPASYIWQVDTIAPTAAMTSTTTNSTNVSPIPVTVQFSEITTDFVVSDITSLVNGVVSNFVAVDGDTYTFDLTPGGQGTVSAAISIGSYSDVSNLNFNTVATAFSRTYDTVSPTVTIDQAAGQIDPTSGAINFTVVFSDAVTGFIGTDVSLSGTAGATTATVTGGPTTYNVAVSGMTAAGTVIATIPAANAKDAANNGNLLSTSTDNSVTHIHDNISPTVISSLRADPNPTSAVIVRFTVTFSEPVSGVDVGDFSLTMSGGVSGSVVTGISGSGSVYTVTVNAGSNNGTLRLNVLNNNSIKDALLNPLAAGFTSGESYTIISKSAIFIDVPYSYWANSYIERLYNAGVSGGCANNPLAYCPDDKVTRAQMAVFLLKTIHGVSYSPPSASGTVFGDVSANYWAAAWVEQFYAEGITSGCGGGNYCPDQVSTTRAQMAILLLRAKYGAAYTPPAPIGRFNDVPTNYWAAAWIEQLAAEGITSGCGGGNYCPENSLTRAEMAIFLVKTLNLP